MQKLLIAALLLMATSGCAQYSGNYAHMSEVNNAYMADDTARELVRLYPPASTHLSLSQPYADEYGKELVKKLRENGYAIEENAGLASLFNFAPKADYADDNDPHHRHTSEPAASPILKKTDSTDTSLSYVVDSVGEGLYRVTLHMDSKVLSRVYKTAGKSMIPAGYWTYKE